MRSIIFGVFLLFCAFSAMILTFYGMMDPISGFYSLFGVAFVASLSLIVLCITFRGMIIQFLNSLLKGHDVLFLLTPGKRLDVFSGPIEHGFIKTKIGLVSAHPEATYVLPNGTRVGIAYYKYGTELPIKIVKAVSVLKKLGIRDGKELENLTKELKKKGKDLMIRVA